MPCANETTKEFPDAREGDTAHALRASASGAAESVRRRASHLTHGHSDPSAQGDDKIERLERLSAMHDSGALTDEEFASEKASLLGS